MLAAALGGEEIVRRRLVEILSRENSSAPSRLRKTCGERSITARARLIGLRVAVTPVTAPALRSLPSMIAASISIVP